MNAWIETDIDDPAFAGAQSRQKRVRHIESRQDILPVAITAPPWAVNAFRRLIPALLTRVAVNVEGDDLRAFSCIAQGNGVTDTRPTAGYHCQVSFEQACHGSSSHQSAH